MTKPPDTTTLPAHLRPLTVDIPRTWTPEEALAVFELIDDLRNKIWALYSDQLQALNEANAGLLTGPPSAALQSKQSSCCSIKRGHPVVPTCASHVPTRTAAVKDGRRPSRSDAQRP